MLLKAFVFKKKNGNGIIGLDNFYSMHAEKTSTDQ